MYFIKRIFSLDLHRMKDIIGKIAKRSNKSPVLIFLDIVISAFCFGSGYMDYYVFNFEELSYRQRSTYITRTINNNYLKKMNNPGFYHIFNDKPTFLKTYQEYIKRVKSNPLARIVKLADLEHNSDMSRLQEIDERSKSLAKRYEKARACLMEANEDEKED